MAGSYSHCVDGEGRLLTDSFPDLVENLGDAYEAIEEMYGMIWFLANGDPAAVEEARSHWADGLNLSPGREEQR